MDAARLQNTRTIFGAFLLISGLFFGMPSCYADGGGGFDHQQMLNTLAFTDMMRNGSGNNQKQFDPAPINAELTNINGTVSLLESLQLEANGGSQSMYDKLSAEKQSLSIKIVEKNTIFNNFDEHDDVRNRAKLLRDQAEEQLKRTQDRLHAIENLTGNKFNPAMFDRRLRESLADLRKRKNNLQNLLKNGAKQTGGTSVFGLAAMRGLAGENAYMMIRDANPDGFVQAVLAGGTYRVATVIGKKIEQTTEEHIGELWDVAMNGTFGFIKDSILNGWYWLFHGGERPFSPNQLDRWKTEVLSVILNDLDKRARESLKEQSSGRDSKMNSLFDATGEAPTDKEVVEMAREKDATWQRIARGYASDLERLAMRIESHKTFYGPQSDRDERKFYTSEKCDIIALATRLQETLRLIRDNILLPSGTLKDLAVGDVKLFLPQLHKELRERFDLLIETVHSYHGTPEKKKNASRSNKSNASSTRGGGYGHNSSYYDGINA